VAVVYCNRCGCENASTRGACLRCLNFIDTPEGTLSCADCGASNVADALYCASCGAAVADVPPAVACSLEVAINLVLGGESDIGPAEDEYDEDEIAPPGVPELDFEEAAEPEEEPAPPPPTAPVAEEVAPPPPPAPEEISAEGLLEDSEAEVAFEPAAGPSFEPPADEAEPELPEVSFEAPEKEPAEEAEEGKKEDEDLGGWVIDFGDSDDK